ncbi:MAG: ribosome small subunit-dependent GTPase A [Woeseiaceae bacterium]
MTRSPSMTPGDAIVIGTFSRRMRLRLADGREVDARIRGKRLRPVCGDRVTAQEIPDEREWLVTAIRDRENALTRPNMRGKIEVLAANIDLLVVVAASPPAPDWFVVDRYLCAAEDMGVPAAIVFNKSDLHGPALPELQDYAAIGYPAVSCSAHSGDGIDRLQAIIRGNTAIIVGQSGVGKSSLINRLGGNARLRTGDVSERSGEGRHTTVNSMLLGLPGGGAVIDSPGVRDYAPALESEARVIHGFRELERTRHDCRFANCRHLREPGCAIKAAVAGGRISARRYESYKRLLALTTRLNSP